MKYDLILIGGGREKDTSKAVNDIYNSLSKKYTVGKVWIDNHGWMWLDNEEGERVALMANRLVLLGNDELIIGADNVNSYHVGKVWPLCTGRNMVSGGIKSVFEFGGFDVIGSGSMMTSVCSDEDMAKLVMKGVNFSDAKSLTISKEDWELNHLDIEDNIGRDFGFPIEMKFGLESEKVSIFENVSNMLFKIFEDGEKVVDIVDAKYAKSQYLIGFVGGKNFLPSKIGEMKGNNVELVDNGVLERELQKFVIDFVKKFDVKDFGMFYIDKGLHDWKVRKVELVPDMSIDGMFAKLWNASGINFNTMVNKIFDESEE